MDGGADSLFELTEGCHVWDSSCSYLNCDEVGVVACPPSSVDQVLEVGFLPLCSSLKIMQSQRARAKSHPKGISSLLSSILQKVIESYLVFKEQNNLGPVNVFVFKYNVIYTYIYIYIYSFKNISLWWAN